ncbi:MAG: hypothetical protein WDM86_18980 [Rhizomicrobium sp.]
MTIKSAKPDSDLPAEDDDDIPRPPTEQEEAELDAWIERNKDALNASFRKADAEYARGHYYTLEEVLAHLESDRRARKG